MKPSERIKIILIDRYDGDLIELPCATRDYLDEEKERINEVLHEIISTMYDGTMGDTQTINYLHQMIDEKLVN